MNDQQPGSKKTTGEGNTVIMVHERHRTFKDPFRVAAIAVKDSMTIVLQSRRKPGESVFIRVLHIKRTRSTKSNRLPEWFE